MSWQALAQQAPLKVGLWLYAGEVGCAVRIAPHDMLYGSGDDEDPPELANDQSLACFYAFVASPDDADRWNPLCGGPTIDAVMALAEAKLGHVA